MLDRSSVFLLAFGFFLAFTTWYLVTAALLNDWPESIVGFSSCCAFLWSFMRGATVPRPEGPMQRALYLSGSLIGWAAVVLTLVFFAGEARPEAELSWPPSNDWRAWWFALGVLTVGLLALPSPRSLVGFIRRQF